jgi:hypothetical protein
MQQTVNICVWSIEWFTKMEREEGEFLLPPTPSWTRRCETLWLE